MKKLFLTGIAALFLATGAPAEEPPGHQLAFEAFAKNVWRFNDYKKCTAQVEFTIPPNPKDWLLRTDLSLANDAAEVVFDRTHLALLWQIYLGRRSLQIHFRQCGHRCGGGRAMSSRIAWRTAGKVGCGGGPLIV